VGAQFSYSLSKDLLPPGRQLQAGPAEERFFFHHWAMGQKDSLFYRLTQQYINVCVCVCMCLCKDCRTQEADEEVWDILSRVLNPHWTEKSDWRSYGQRSIYDQ
jgi:hypothetical protein